MEPEVYLWLAEGRGWRITQVLDTHVHADHLSRSRRLAELVGVSVHMPEEATVSYPFSALGDGDVLRVGSATLKAILTPGHTPEGTSYLLDEQALFTGDTLFLSAVGRPDLDATPEGSRERARELYRSLRHLLRRRPEFLPKPRPASQRATSPPRSMVVAAVGSTARATASWSSPANGPRPWKATSSPSRQRCDWRNLTPRRSPESRPSRPSGSATGSTSASADPRGSSCSQPGGSVTSKRARTRGCLAT